MIGGLCGRSVFSFVRSSDTSSKVTLVLHFHHQCPCVPVGLSLASIWCHRFLEVDLPGSRQWVRQASDADLAVGRSSQDFTEHAGLSPHSAGSSFFSTPFRQEGGLDVPSVLRCFLSVTGLNLVYLFTSFPRARPYPN